MPRIVSSEAVTRLQFQEFFTCCPALGSAASLQVSDSDASWFAASDFQSQTALQKCAQLCRFLA